MLRDLHLRGLGVIDEATLEFARGLTALTGETGAGKTMITTGLGLLLADRADPALVRTGATRAVVEGSFEATHLDHEHLDQLGAELDGDEVVLGRQITAAGRSRAFLGGAHCSLAALAEVSGQLATIHGQSEQVRLAAPERQRAVLDRAAGAEHRARLESYRQLYDRRQRRHAAWVELTSHARERAREVDLLRFGLAEIEAVAPQPAEDHTLAERYRRLQAADDVRALATRITEALSGDDYDDDRPSAVGLVGQARRDLATLAEIDPAAARLHDQATETASLLNDLAAELASYLADLETDPAELEQVVTRQAELAKLTRKYGLDIDHVLAWSAEQATRLLTLTDTDGRSEELRVEIDALTAELQTLATAISQSRHETATRVAEAVQVELAALAMPHARLRFDLTDLAEVGPHGRDHVQVMFSANPGSALAPLAKAASGGELSRVRLALEVVLADDTQGHTFVFDEVDAGVGGAVGLEIGRRLARLAENSQVVVVTHLAQVAAFADQHLVVRKSSNGQVTSSDVTAVTGPDRLKELARMMGGLDEAASALDHARDLLAVAHSSASNSPKS